MGFKSVMKKVGKVALKAAPIAAAFIPGVGPLASMAISAGTSAAAKKASGGSWKDALLAGGIGAATSKIPIKGLGPSSTAVSKSVGEGMKMGAKTGFKSALGNVAKGVLSNIGGAPNQPIQQPGSWKDTIGGLVDRFSNRDGGQQQQPSYRTPDFVPQQAVPRGGSQVMPRGGYNYRNNPMNQVDQSNPNLAQSIFQGRQEAIRNQPFRKGYDVNFLGSDDETPYTTRMPPIRSERGGRSIFQPTANIQGPATSKKKKSRIPQQQEEEMAY